MPLVRAAACVCGELGWAQVSLGALREALAGGILTRILTRIPTRIPPAPAQQAQHPRGQPQTKALQLICVY